MVALQPYRFKVGDRVRVAYSIPSANGPTGTVTLLERHLGEPTIFVDWDKPFKDNLPHWVESVFEFEDGPW